MHVLYEVLVLSAAVLLCGGAVFLVRRFVKVERFKVHHEVGGLIFLQLGVIYGVLLTFVVVAVWDNFQESESLVAHEAASLEALVRTASGLAEPAKSEVRAAVVAYADAVVAEEWPMLEHGAWSDTAAARFRQIDHVLTAAKVDDSRQAAVLGAALDRMGEAREARTGRILRSQQSLNSAFWVLLFGLGLLLILQPYLFVIEHAWAQVFFICSIVVVILFKLMQIGDLDHAFGGHIRVSPEAFQLLKESVVKG